MFSCTGRARTLILGVINEIPTKSEAKLRSVTRYDYASVKYLAAVDEKQISSFASLLKWIRDNMIDGDKKTLSFGNGNFNLRTVSLISV